MKTQEKSLEEIGNFEITWGPNPRAMGVRRYPGAVTTGSNKPASIFMNHAVTGLDWAK